MNKISDRLKFIFSHLPNCNYFADIGCDHGYISQLMLKEQKCKQLVYSDISAPSLQKAQKLLSGYENAKPVCCSGLEKIDQNVDCVLIAGMGGENIISILQNGFLPKTLVLQPMKNIDKLRVYLNKNGYFLQKDFIFKAENKFYNLLIAVKGSQDLSQEEIEYGIDNLQNPSKDFLEYLGLQIESKQKILKGLTNQKQIDFAKQLDKEISLYERLRIKASSK